MKYESFDITANNLRFRGKYGYENTLPTDIVEIMTCVIKNLKGSLSILCCSSEKALSELRTVCDVSYFEIDDVSTIQTPVKDTTADAEAVPKSWLCGCGKENEGNFCTHCGKKRPPVVRYCASCGEKLEDKANFCGNCGKKI